MHSSYLYFRSEENLIYGLVNEIFLHRLPLVYKNTTTIDTKEVIINGWLVKSGHTWIGLTRSPYTVMGYFFNVASAYALTHEDDQI